MFFLPLIVIGLAGLFVMALPAFGRHGHAHGGLRHASFGRAALPRGGHARGAAGEILAGDADAPRRLRFIPSPRTVCSLLALYGAFGNALVRAGHLALPIAAVVALVPALLVEWWVVRPVWNLLFRFQGQPSSPLEDLVLSDATAVVPFRNGRGVVSAVRDGRAVQFSARLRDDQRSLPVRVGDRLRIEDVDPDRERVTVTLLSTPELPPR